MKLLLRLIVLLAFCCFNGYSTYAVPSKGGVASVATISLDKQQVSGYSLQQANFNTGHLPSQPKKLFRKTRATKEDDDDESRFACLKKAKSQDADLHNNNPTLKYTTIAFDAQQAPQLILKSGTLYTPLPITSSGKLYRLFGVFRI